MRNKYTLKFIEDYWQQLRFQELGTFNTKPIHEKVENTWKLLLAEFISKATGFGVIDEYVDKKPKSLENIVNFKRELLKTLGTINIDDFTAPFFELNSQILDEIKNTTLSEWNSAFNNPEDPFFIDKQGLFLSTKSHEYLIFLYLTDKEYLEYEETFPNLELAIVNEDSVIQRI